MSNSKVIITGSSGLLGRAIYKTFKECTSLDVTGLVYSRNKDNNKIQCDLTNSNDLIKCFDKIKPNYVIHAAAERRPDVVTNNLDKTRKLNVESTLLIAKWCEENNSTMIFISTDYVFDGTNPPYDETACPNPLNEYGKMKVEGEKIVLNNKNIILRIPVLYGNIEYIEETAVTILFDKVKSSNKAQMSNYEKRYPTHCEDIAHTLLNVLKYIIKNGSSSLNGVLHYQTEEELTKLEMSIIMAKIFNLPYDHLVEEPIPTGSEATKRPYKSKLSCEKLKSLNLYYEPRSFENGIKDVLMSFV